MLVDLVDFTHQISLGAAIIAATAGFYALVSLWRGSRYKTAAEVAEANSRIYAEGREAFKQRAERLDEELKESLKLIGDQKRTIARLEALPNLQAIVELMADTAKRQDETSEIRAERALEVMSKAIKHQDERAQQRMEDHEKRAQDRHDQQMEVMQEMSKALVKANGRTEH
jgi:hypothetical protein